MNHRPRWPYIVGGILGGVLVAGALYNLAIALANPETAFRLNLVRIVTNTAQIAIGVFLVAIFLRHKKAEDAGQLQLAYPPNSPEDLEFLKKRRNWIFGFVILLEIFGSLETWIMNDYFVGFTPFNLQTVFDVLANVVLFYLMIQLFRNKNVLNLLFYAVIAYGLIHIGFDIWRKEWFVIIINALFTFYFVYAIKAPLNRSNHRIVHFVLLPLFIASTIAFGSFDTGKVDGLWKKNAQLEQNFGQANSVVTTSYNSFLEHINEANIHTVRESLIKRDKVIGEAEATLAELEEAYKDQHPSVIQVKALEKIDKMQALFGMHRRQADKVRELVTYVEGLDLEDVSEEESEKVMAYIKEVNDLGLEIGEAFQKINQ